MHVVFSFLILLTDGRVPPVNEIHNAHAFIGRPASGKKRRKSKLGQVMVCQINLAILFGVFDLTLNIVVLRDTRMAGRRPYYLF